MNDLTAVEIQKMIENLPPYLRDLAIEVQEKNDEYEKTKKQLIALKEQALGLEQKAKNIFEEYEESVMKINKIHVYISENSDNSQAEEEQIKPVLNALIKRIKEYPEVIESIKTENELIIQDITIFSEDEVKLKRELDELNQTLKINLDFALQNNK